ncbi:MAG: hypothetical protein IT450_02075 [Phycisphaerales bacterium]|nr:hypothetical protein [Phycisphaerales bacterium]
MTEAAVKGDAMDDGRPADGHRTDAVAESANAAAAGSVSEPTPATVGPRDRGPLTEDVFCIGCGYNLRGLSGEMIRCPECGDSTPAEVLEYPAALIRKYLRKLESHLALGVAMLLMALPAIYTGVTDPNAGSAIALLLLAIAWVALITNFRKLCNGRTDWRRGIFRSHVVGCLACIAVVAVVAGSVIASDLLLGPGRMWRGYRMLAGVAAFPVIVVVLVPIARRLHKWLTASMTVMRREVAVSLAKEYFAERGA